MTIRRAILMSAVVAPMMCPSQVYTDPSASPRDRATDIVSRMTLDEKVSLMKYESAAVPRLGIKQYNWWNEALHGVARAGLATVFPQPIGLAATFDDGLVYEVFTAASDEARAKHQIAKSQGPLKIYQGLTFWTPNVNIFRDPRWGRGHETYGEDPYLTSRMGKSVVRGLQGDSYEGGYYTGADAPQYYKLHACAKHFAVHSGPEWNRHSFNAKDIDHRDLWETYLPAFQALVEDAGVKEVMCAYNRYEDEPCCGNNRLLQQILRDEWGFDGIVTSDCWAINDFFADYGHKTEPDAQHAASKAVRTGTDLECGQTYGNLVEAVEKGLITEADIDRSLIRLMTARYQLGEMDADSLVAWTQIPASVIASDANAILAGDAARKSMVLLKNDGTLPLRTGLKVGLIGPNANDSVMQWGNYNGFPSATSTLLSSLEERLGKDNVIYVAGIDHTSDMIIESLFSDTRSSSGKPGFDAIFYNDMQKKSGTPDATYQYTQPLALTSAGATVWAPGVNLGGFRGIFSTTFVAPKTEKVVFGVQTQGHVEIAVDGKRMFKGGNMKNPQALTLDVEQGKEYDIKITYRASEGDCSSMYIDFGRQQPMDIDSLISQLADADVILFAGGLSPSLEGEEMPVKIPGFNGGDREDIELPKVQQRVLADLQRLGKPVVMVNYSGSAVALTDEKAPCNALLQAWYPGQEGGEAVVDVLMGDYNPAGRLPVTLYRTADDISDFQDYSMRGRTYRYFGGEPLYPFGHGLSYTTFDYGDATIAQSGEQDFIVIPVTNTGETAGDEVVQLYVSRPDDTDGPTRTLRDFRRVNIQPGQTVNVEFALTDDTFLWYDPEDDYMRPTPGEYLLQYGPSSEAATLKEIRYDWQSARQSLETARHSLETARHSRTAQ